MIGWMLLKIGKMNKKFYKQILNKIGEEYSFWYANFQEREYDPDSNLTWGQFYEPELIEYLKKSQEIFKQESKDKNYYHWFAHVEFEDSWNLASPEERAIMFYYANVIQDEKERGYDW